MKSAQPRRSSGRIPRYRTAPPLTAKHVVRLASVVAWTRPSCQFGPFAEGSPEGPATNFVRRYGLLLHSKTGSLAFRQPAALRPTVSRFEGRSKPSTIPLWCVHAARR